MSQQLAVSAREIEDAEVHAAGDGSIKRIPMARQPVVDLVIEGVGEKVVVIPEVGEAQHGDAKDCGNEAREEGQVPIEPRRGRPVSAGSEIHPASLLHPVLLRQ
jgi:hypothetical protein